MPRYNAAAMALLLLSGCGSAPSITLPRPLVPQPAAAQPAQAQASAGTSSSGAVPDQQLHPTAPEPVPAVSLPGFSGVAGSAAVDAPLVDQPAPRLGSCSASGNDGSAPSGAQADESCFAAPTLSSVPNEIIVAVKPGQQLRQIQSLSGFRTVSSVNVGVTYQVVQIPAGMTVQQAEAVYAADPAVSSVQENHVYSVSDYSVQSSDPNDPGESAQWGMQQVDAPDAWAHDIDASNITVAVLDTGIDYTHPKLAGRVELGWNVADGNKDVSDHFGHGTHVAGIIGAQGGDGGLEGVCDTCKLMAVKVLGDNGEGTTDAVIQGIQYAVQYGANIINMSLGSSDTAIDPALGQAIAYARQHNVLVICAAGNDGGDVTSPANDPNAIAVSSTSKFLWWEYLSWFSNRGSKIEVGAPGGGIWSTVPETPNETGAIGYAKLSGTSMAAPMVSGEAALIEAAHPEFDADAVQQRIDQAVDVWDGGRNDRVGFGRIRLDLAVQ